MPVKFFQIYNREAHLEWKAKSTEERFQRALYSQQLSEIVTGEEQVITTLVDEVRPGEPGSSIVSEAYGNTSNGVTIVDQDGKIIFFAHWYRFGEVDEFLTELGKKEGWLTTN
ncbi:hypothetical protein MYX82_10375 [Acidobacteria bacterium AH-259-D05]|nr:hypothetical protein [Acidobacteria bacterium AH-259-D05]